MAVFSGILSGAVTLLQMPVLLEFMTVSRNEKYSLSSSLVLSERKPGHAPKGIGVLNNLKTLPRKYKRYSTAG